MTTKKKWIRKLLVYGGNSIVSELLDNVIVQGLKPDELEELNKRLEGKPHTCMYTSAGRCKICGFHRP